MLKFIKIKHLIILSFFFFNFANAFEKKIILCPPQKGVDYPTIYKTYLSEDKKAKIALVKKKEDSPVQGVPYFAYNDLGGGDYEYGNIENGDIIRWVSVKKLPDTQAFIWSAVYFLKDGILSETFAFLSDEELKAIIKISKDNPGKIEEAKLKLINQKELNNQLDDSVVYQNCKIQ